MSAAPAETGAVTGAVVAASAAPFTLIPLGDASAAACDGDSCALPSLPA
ncbi:hypothetical protein [Leifsonia aquatica]|nr:hypothetical protein [Leifsonia aquatica]